MTKKEIWLIGILCFLCLQACSNKKTQDTTIQTYPQDETRTLIDTVPLTQDTTVQTYLQDGTKTLMDTVPLPQDNIPQFPQKLQKDYVIHLISKTPYELYLDDILISAETKNNTIETVEINPFLLKNGIHRIKMRYFPLLKSSAAQTNRLLHPEDVYHSKDNKSDVYFFELDPLTDKNKLNFPAAALKIVPPSSPVPFWEQEWTVKVNNIPYDIVGWQDGEDLSTWDRDELEEQVLAYYQKLHSVMNKGQIAEYTKMTKRRDIESAISFYYTQQEYVDRYTQDIKDLKKMAVGRMLPISKYEMKLYADNKLVSLLIPSNKYKAWGVLRSSTSIGEDIDWNVFLYKPKGSDDFVFIRN